MELLRAEIHAAPDRRITFARFMERTLTEPSLGYYAVRDDRPSRSGDFLTAPELHPWFGRCLGRLIQDVWERLDRPGPMTVHEWGGGRGTLARAVADGLAADQLTLAGSLDWQLIDLGQPEGEREGSTPSMILANEFLDALPVHRVVRRGGRLLERYVGWQDGWFSETTDLPSSEELVGHLRTGNVELAEGQAAEISLEALHWAEHAGRELDDGLLLVIDYGHDASDLYGPRRMAGTLMTYRDHRAGTDPFVAVGRQDLTSHVDLSALKRTMNQAGICLLGDTTLAQLLVVLGLGDLLRELGTRAETTPEQYLLARSSVARLLDPRHLGAFRVLAWGRGIAASPPIRGFARAV